MDPADADDAFMFYALATRKIRSRLVQFRHVLDDIETVSSRFVITPVVGIAPHPYAWRPSPHEVDAIFTVPLRVLRSPGAERFWRSMPTTSRRPPRRNWWQRWLRS